MSHLFQQKVSMWRVRLHLCSLIDIVKIILINCVLISTCVAETDIILQLKWKHQFQFAGYYAAQMQGYYQDEGLNVTINEANPKRSVSDIVLNNDAQFGIADSSLVLSRLNGDPVVILAAVFQHSPLVLITLESSGIVSPLELFNKKVMYQKNNDDAAIRAMLSEMNLTDSKYTHVPHTFNDEILITGDVDAMSSYVTNQPFLYKARNIPINIITPANYGIDFYGDMLFATEDYVQSNKDSVLSFRRASLKGWAYALEHPEKIIDWMIKNYRPDKSREHLLYEANETFRMIRPDLIELGYFNVSRLQRIADIYASLGEVPSLIDLQGIYYLDHYNPGFFDQKYTKAIVLVVTGLFALAGLLWFFNCRLKKEVQKQTRQYQRSEEALSTEKQVAEKALSDLKDQKYALDQHAIVAITDIEGNITYANRRFCEISGYTEDELLGNNHRLHNSGTHNQAFFEEMYQSLLKGDTWHGEICNRAKDGHSYWVDTTIVPLFDDSDTLTSYIAMRTDITKRKIAETSLANSEELMRGLFELSPVGIALNDYETGEFIKVNDGLLKSSGYTQEEFLSLSYWDITPVSYEDQEKEQLVSLESTGKYGPYEKEYINKEGEYYPVLLNGMLVNDPFSGKKLIWSIVEDITYRKQIEKDLINAKEVAEDAVSVKSNFLASMSHEIRTPMNGVIGMLDLVLNTKLEQSQKHKLEIAHFSAQSLLTLINDILDYSKVDAGKLDLESIDYDLKELMGDVAEAMAQQAQSKGLELVLDIAHIKDHYVNGDPGRLRQILTNLIGNAIKFTEEGEIIIRAEAADHDDDSIFFLCSIIDTGIGIPKEKLDVLFESFSQIDVSTTRKYGGTGLGLAISKKLCALMGGDIRVISTPNQGSCFEFYFTLKKGQKTHQGIPNINIDSLNILVVDQNDSTRRALKSQLVQWGASVTDVSNANNALVACEENHTKTKVGLAKPFDLAFIEYFLSDMDGDRLGETLLKSEFSKGIKLVMMTTIASYGDAQRFTEIGFSAYFPKPVTSKDLYNALAVIVATDNENKNLQLVTRHYLRSLEANNASNNISDSLFSGARVLLVEDNEVNQMIAEEVLINLGLTVEISNDGLNALDKLNMVDDQRFDCILMDCLMPNMDGYETTEAIRQGSGGESYINIPIIAMTANAMKGDKEKCFSVGMNGYVSKPVDVNELKKQLLKYLS